MTSIYNISNPVDIHSWHNCGDGPWTENCETLVKATSECVVNAMCCLESC